MKKLNVNDLVDDNVIEIESYLLHMEKTFSLYSGNYKADWLLSDIHANTWILKTSRTIKNKDGYKYTYTITWERLLPDGTFLTDECNSSFLHLVQKILFLIKEDKVSNQITSTQSIHTMSSSLLMLISWIYLYKDKFLPNDYGFSRLTSLDIKQSFKDYATGGVFNLLRTPHRILMKMDVGIEITPDKNFLDLNKIEIKKAIEYFKDNDFYIENKITKLKHINRSKICSEFMISKQEIKNHASSAFFRQFELDYLAENKDVLIPLTPATKYPSHKTPLIDEIKIKNYKGSYIEDSSRFIFHMMKLYDEFSDQIPNPDRIKLEDINVNYLLEDYDYTPLIPLSTSLHILNKSIGMLLKDGDAIIDFFRLMLRKFRELGGITYQTNLSEGFKSKLVIKQVPKSLSHYNIVGLFRLDKQDGEDISFLDIKEGEPIYLNTLIMIFQAACFTCISGLKPIRGDEFSNLKYDCLSYQDGDGWWLSHCLKKSGIEDILPETSKPIPNISAKAIMFLQSLNDLAREFAVDYHKNEPEYLLFQLRLPNSIQTGSILKLDQINSLYSMLCDYFGSDIDEFGRRWYINSHELRKSFLLHFFWTFKYASIDACRWIAGHKDAEHIYNYIRTNMPGEEMAEIEAEYASQQVRLFNKNNSFTELENIEGLYTDVCEHFGVKDVTEVNSKELHQWIQLAIKKGIYNIEVYSLDGFEDLLNSTRIIFKIREKA